MSDRMERMRDISRETDDEKSGVGQTDDPHRDAPASSMAQHAARAGEHVTERSRTRERGDERESN